MARRYLRLSCILALILGPLAASASTAEETSAGPIQAVLWIGGFAHDFESMARIMAATLPQHAPLEIEVARDGSFLDRPDSNRPDVILMQHCHESASGVLTESQKKNLLKLIQGGTGVVAVHASYYSFVGWEEVRALYGTRFIQHGEVDIDLSVRFVDREHPITRALPAAIVTHSELYQSEPLAKDCHLLAVARQNGTDTEYPSVWTRMFGQGRVVTILPAHWPDAYEKAAFQKLIAGSAKWAAKR
jgi:type 1 glutamine amidotransferase